MPATSDWSKSQPSGSSSIALGDDMLRSDKSVLEATLNYEHYFTPQTSASSASGGLHRHGSARIFANATRASIATPSSADSDGKLVYAVDTESLHYIGASSNTTVVWGRQPAGAGATSNATTLGSGASTALILALETYDVGGYFTSDTSQMVVPSGLSGLHLITAGATFPSLHTGNRRAIALCNVQGIPYAVASVGTGVGAAAGGISVSLAHTMYLSDATKLTINGFQDSGGNLSVNSIYFQVTRL